MYTLAIYFIFFFNDTATTEIYTLSLHDALPISDSNHEANGYNQQTPGFSGWILQSPFSFKNRHVIGVPSSSSFSSDFLLSESIVSVVITLPNASCSSQLEILVSCLTNSALDRKSTRLNSSHASISYAV